jgi:hypothetical protein
MHDQASKQVLYNHVVEIWPGPKADDAMPDFNFVVIYPQGATLDRLLVRPGA